jgi:uncharacterized protein
LLDTLITLAILVTVGLGAGTLGSILGVGGGIIMVPVLTFLNIPPTQAASTSLIAVLSTSVSSTIEYSRQKRIDYRLGLQMAACAVPGGVIGAVVSVFMPEGSFKLYFGILLMLTGLYITSKNSILRNDRAKKRSLSLRIAVFASSFGAGIMSSLFGVGGGIVFVPSMLLVLGLTMYRAAPTSQLILMITGFAGVLTHSVLGHPDYLHAIALSIGAFAGAQIGTRLSKFAQDLVLQRLMGLLLVAVSTTLILEGMTLS